MYNVGHRYLVGGSIVRHLMECKQCDLDMTPECLDWLTAFLTWLAPACYTLAV